MNLDGVIYANNLPQFTDASMNPTQYQADFDAGLVGSADMNQDGNIDGRDIQGFVDRVVNGF